MQEIIISLMEQYGYIGIALLICIENIFPPIPSEVILTFGGFMTTYTSSTIVGVIISSTIGALIGALILYYIGKLLNKERLMKIVSGKIGKILFLKPSDIEKADTWFDKKGNKTVFFCRFIPVIRSLISIPAGMSNMKMWKFLLYTVCGTVIWNTVLVVLGRTVGDSWGTIVNIVNKYTYITVAVIGVAVVLGIVYFYKKRKSKAR